LDIGCGKGGFLLDFATSQLQDTQQEKKNYLGLEIRPGVAQYAQDRILNRSHLHGHLSFIGCNANVDLQRILSLYMSGDNDAELGSVSIQFPDPHFKSQHVKRRVVNQDLVLTLAKFMKEGKTIFIQSDVQELLDDMRERIREQSMYFEDEIEDITEYMLDNPLGVPTEREISVLAKDLPVYRTIFRRTSVPVVDVDVDTVDE
jgi:tRNA (guanine-N7-)-methyltransferase